MLALNRKLLRDLFQMKGQSLAIIAVMACGVATFVMSLTTLESLQVSQSTYYDRYRFAEVFARVKRAPQSLAQQIGEIPGVAVVQTRIVEDVTLDIPTLPEPAIGRLISVPETGRPELNNLHLRSGRWIEPGRPGEILASESFALVHNLSPGDSIRAIINGKLQDLNIVGIVLSPEYVLSIAGSQALPDEKRFGVFWMGYRELSSAFDMYEAFNDVTLTLMKGANEAEVLRRLDILTEPYGGVGAYGREDQLSNRFLSDEIKSLRGMGLIVPVIFLSVAAFLLNVVMTRLISTQREQIAALKAFGYSKFEVGGHYLKFVLAISLVGALVGAALGIWLAHALTGMYSRFYKFPAFVFAIQPGVMFAGLMTGAGAAVAGTLAAVAKAVNLPAAEAMRPEPPANYRPTLLERLGLQRSFAQTWRMVLRQIERRPLKSSLSILGIAMAVAVLVMGRFLDDGLDYMITFGFYTQQRQDVTVNFVEPTTLSAFHELTKLPGVLRVEPIRSIAVRLKHGNHVRRVGIMGISPGAQLHRVIDGKMFPVEPPPDGLILTDKLAEVLEVSAGQTVRVEVQEGRRPIAEIPVVDTVREFAGTNAYVSIDALRRLMREDDVINGAALQVDASKIDELYRTLKETPRVASVTVKEASVKTFNETQGENQKNIQFFNIIFACIIAMGVVYNTARISLSERGRELATLRVIGFTRGEISAILLGELALLTLCALPVGMVLGYFFAWMATLAFNSEMFRLPLVVSRYTYGFAAMVVIIAAIVSGLLVRRRLDHLDLVSVLKSKE